MTAALIQLRPRRRTRTHKTKGTQFPVPVPPIKRRVLDDPPPLSAETKRKLLLAATLATKGN